MNLQKIKEIAKHLMVERKAQLEREKGGIYYHGERVANLALALRKEILPDNSSYDDILTVSALFHDCAKGIEPHDEYGSIVARHALKNHLPEDELNKVINLIEVHCMRKPDNNDYDAYTKILQDADMIDHFGIYQIWMNIQYWAHTDGSFHDMIDYYKKNHESNSSKHRKLLNYEYSKNIFDERIAFEREFVLRLYDEGIGNIHNPKKEG